jgi:hypothetical protein
VAKTKNKARRWLVGVGLAVGGVVLLIVLTAFLPESAAERVGSTTNNRANGTKALAQVLRADGVQVAQVTELDDAADAGADETLAVWLDRDLSDDAVARLDAVPADLVLIVVDPYAASDAVRDLTAGAVEAWDMWLPEDAAEAGCSLPEAEAAGTVTVDDVGFWPIDASEDVELCFLAGYESSVLADLHTASHRVTLVGSTSVFRNGTITREGNAALALWTLGRHDRLTWYLPGDDAELVYGGDAALPSVWSLLPEWSRAVLGLLVLAGLAAAAWRGRRLGRLVPEPLPVAVPASEVASGLGRLYRQAGARGHAAAGLRAATAHRLAVKLGLPLGAAAEVVAERVGLATGRPVGEVQALLYGRAPDTDAALADLARLLRQLEEPK